MKLLSPVRFLPAADSSWWEGVEMDFPLLERVFLFIDAEDIALCVVDVVGAFA